MIYRGFLTMALLAGLPLAAQAEDKVTLASCDDGGCRCRLGAISAEEAALTAGIAPPPGPGATLVAANGTLAWTLLSPDAVDLVMGGDGRCALELFDEIEPADGLWREGPVTVEAVSCGAGTPQAAAMLAGQPRHVMAIAWNGVFDGEAYQAAARAFDPESTPHRFTRLSARVSEGRVETNTETGPLVSVARLELVDPHRFTTHWQVSAHTEAGPCNWSISFPVEWVQP